MHAIGQRGNNGLIPNGCHSGIAVFLKAVFANVSDDERYIGGCDDIAIGVDGHLAKLHLQLRESDQVVDGVAPLKHEVASIVRIVSKVVDRVD